MGEKMKLEDMYKGITFDIKRGSISIEPSPLIIDENGRYRIGHARVVERDEYGKVTRDELIEPAAQLIYEDDNKKWWEFWK